MHANEPDEGAAPLLHPKAHTLNSEPQTPKAYKAPKPQTAKP